MSEEVGAPRLEELRDALRKDIHDEVRNALREMTESRVALGGGEFDSFPLGPLGTRCYIIIAVPVIYGESGGHERFRILAEQQGD